MQPLRIDTLRQRLTALGARPAHVQRVLRLWSLALPQDSGSRRIADFLPDSLLDALPALEAELQGLARLRSQHPSEDGSVRLLVDLADGQTVESVLLPRGGLCVSSQVGCAVGCVFCMTGKDGLLRQVGGAEIVAQVVLARTLRSVKKVVFMGMGEPAHNLDNVMDAIDLLGTVGNIGHKSLVFSTVGDPRVSSAFRKAGSNRRWRCRCTPPSPDCARNCCHARRGWTLRTWWRRGKPMHAAAATRSSTSGR